MAIRLSLVLLLLALALVAESSLPSGDAFWALPHLGGVARGSGALAGSQTCKGLVGECIGNANELMMDSEINRRGLRPRTHRFISYAALKKDAVPCGRRGHSYYNCQRSTQVNPYRRGCSVITHCARNLN